MQRLRIPRVLSAIVLSALIALAAAAPAAASSPQPVSLTWVTAHSSTINVPPAATWQPLSINLVAAQVTGFTLGFVSLNDRGANVRLTGYIDTMAAIADGYSFSGCGWASGDVSGSVCFAGTVQELPNGSQYDHLTFTLTSGGSYSISGNLPLGSVQANG